MVEPRLHTPAEFTPLEKAFSKYLGQKGIYEKTLWQGLQKLEYLIGKSIAMVVPGTNPNIVGGMIWANNQVNPSTSPQDIERALDIIRRVLLRKKQGQATVDTWDPEVPGAFKFNPTGDDAIQPIDPLDSQQIGRSQNELPSEMSEAETEEEDPDVPAKLKSTKPTMDDRVYELLKMKKV